MNPLLGKITELRQGAPLLPDRQNKNRYRIVSTEPDGSKTAYCFASPIYHYKTRKLVDVSFRFLDGAAHATGSNAEITVSDRISLKSDEGRCSVSLPARISRASENELVCGNTRIYPTVNGVAIRSLTSGTEGVTFTLETDRSFLNIRANDKYVALMQDRFCPFVVISCIGTSNSGGCIIAPAKISYQKNSDRSYTVSVVPCSPLGTSVLFEINLYEAKLFRDTTVESHHPKVNNVFGSVGFIGTTKEFGEQWLYSFPDVTKTEDLGDRKLLRAVLYLPRLNTAATKLSAFGLRSRFCSFGSTWSNRIAETEVLSDARMTDRFLRLDLTPVLSDQYGRLTGSNGFILRSTAKETGFSVIPTGDSYFIPQILEINYR